MLEKHHRDMQDLEFTVEAVCTATGLCVCVCVCAYILE
jgi:hypothetical protein